MLAIPQEDWRMLASNQFMRVPYLDIKLQNEPLRTEIRAAIDAVIDKSSFAGGLFVEAFESNFAAYCGTRHAVG